MKKLLAGLFVFGFLFIGNQAHASILSDALSQIKNLKNEILLLKSSLKASVLDVPMGVTSTTDLTPRISYWSGKVNQHVDVESSTWQTDADGSSGAEIDKLTYCKKFYPNTTSVTEYKKETINSWHAGGNEGNYTGTAMSYKCVEEVARPYSLLASNVTLNSLTLNWTNSVSYPTCFLYYGTNYNTVSSYSGTGNAGGCSNRVISGLYPNTNYYFKVQGVYNGVYSGYSNVYTVKTLSNSNLPDLAVIFPKVTPNGNQVKIEANIDNPSDYSTGKSFTNRFEINSQYNGQGSMTSSYNYLLTALADDTDIKIDYTFSLPNGRYSTRVCADINSEIAETNESNNCNDWKNFDIENHIVDPVVPSITVLSPNGGEVYEAGSWINVKWKTEDIQSTEKIVIILDSVLATASINDGYNMSGSDGTLNDGSENYVLNSSLKTGTYQIRVLYKNIFDSSDRYFTINSADTTPTLDLTPRISMWQGKVNQHVAGMWFTDPDGTSGAGIDKLTYCKKWYPNTIKVEEYKKETINTWRAGGDTRNYTGTAMSYKCVQGTTTPSITILSPNGGEVYKAGEKVTVKWNSVNVPTANRVIITLANIKTGVIIYLTDDKNIPAIYSLNDGIETFNIPTSDYSGIETGSYKFSISALASDGKTGVRDESSTFTINSEKEIEPSVNVYATWTEKEIKNFDINTVTTGIIASSDGKKIITVGEYSRYIYKSNDGGETWTTQTNVGEHDQNSGRIFTSSNGTKSGWEIRGWYSIASSSDMKKIVLSGHAGDSPYGTTSYIYTSIDGGDTWTEHSTPEGAIFYSIISSPDGSKLTALSNGSVYISKDSAVTWTKQTNSTQYNLSYLTSSSDGSILFATKRGTGYENSSIYKSIDGGVNWFKLNAPSLVSWNGISTSSDGKKVVAVGSCKNNNDCHIFTSVDGGNTWIAQKNNFPGSSQYYTSVTSSSDGKNLAATGWTNIYLSKDSGVTWTAQKGMDGLIFNSVLLLGDSSRIIAGNFNGRIFVGELDNGSGSRMYANSSSSNSSSSDVNSNDNSDSSSESSITRTLKVGVKGDDVKILQSLLGLDTDGSFGPKTKAKVVEWQKANGLTADGAFGAKSRAVAGI